MALKCDICGADITTSQCGNWKINLMVAPIPCGSGSTFDMYVSPPLKPGNYDFCSKNCLIKFIEKS